MQKRGQFEVLQLSFLFEVLIAVAIAAMFIYSAVSFDVFSKFKKEYADADITLIMDQVISAPGAVEVTYPISSKYKVTISGDSVDVKSEPSLVATSKGGLLISKDSSANVDVRRYE